MHTALWQPRLANQLNSLQVGSRPPSLQAAVRVHASHQQPLRANAHQSSCASSSSLGTSDSASHGSPQYSGAQSAFRQQQRSHRRGQIPPCRVAAPAAPSTERSQTPDTQQQQGIPGEDGPREMLLSAAAAGATGASMANPEDEKPSEAGILPNSVHLGAPTPPHTPPRAAAGASARASFTYPPAERNQIRESWDTLMRWSKVLQKSKTIDPLETVKKVVVFGGGSFGTAMGVALANQKADLEVVLLLRDPALCRDINVDHCNTRYLKDFKLPPNVRATTNAAEAIAGAQYAVHAVPVQSSRAFLVGIRDLLPPTVPIICVSKGLEVGSGQMMSELIPSALERKQPAVFLSGPSFAKEVMENRPTGVVAACKDAKLARTVQALFASQSMRVNTTNDVVGVEICGALKNVLAIAAGIVQGLDLGHNALAALIAQGCSEIRWLAEKIGAKPTTMSGLSGLGDIMLTCYGSLSRNRSVGIRLGKGEKLQDILASSPQVAEGVATAGVVVSLARKYRVSLPVLTAVAQVCDNALTPSEAVTAVMNLPQVEEH